MSSTSLRVAPSTESWVRAATADLPTLLLDHAHCEKKAASTAVRFLFKYPDWPSLVTHMSRLAREELVHFDQVRRELGKRGHSFRALHASNYAAALFTHIRKGHVGHATVDEMLVCALIEARSHERFVRLSAALTVEDPSLAAFYDSLGEAEARHGDMYLELAEEAAEGPVTDRLAELTIAEAEIVARPDQPTRMHSGG